MFGDQVKLIRKSLHMSQREFAKEWGYAQSFVSAIENGEKNPSYDSLISLQRIVKKFKIKNINLISE